MRIDLIIVDSRLTDSLDGVMSKRVILQLGWMANRYWSMFSGIISVCAIHFHANYYASICKILTGHEKT